MIIKFNNYINERMGILFDIEDICDDIFEMFKDSDYFEYKTKYRGRNITIECFKIDDDVVDKKNNYSAYFSVIDNEKNIFKIVIGTDISKSLIFHELKHLDHCLSRDYKPDDFYYIYHTGKYVITKFKHLIKNSDVLLEVLYSITRNEFESYYNEFYFELKDKIKDDMSNEEKRKIIDEHLNDTTIYDITKYYYHNSFKLEDFFRTKMDLSAFLNMVVIKIENWDNEEEYNIKSKDILKSRFTQFINMFKNDILLDKIDQSLLNQINRLIDGEAKRNFKKFHRLYTHFLS